MESENFDLKMLKELFLNSKNPAKFFRDLQKTGKLKEFCPELDALVDVEGCPVAHPEGSVFEHTMQTLDASAQLKGLDEDKKFMIMLGVLCHDFGKVIRKDKNWDPNVSGINDQHDIAGVPLAQNFMRRLTKDGALIKGVCKLVRYHLVPFAHFQSIASPDSYKKLLSDLAPEVTIEDLYLVGWCDIQGCNARGHEPLTRGVALTRLLMDEKNLELFLKLVGQIPIANAPEVPVLLHEDLSDLAKSGRTVEDLIRAAYCIQIDEGIKDKNALKKRLS